MNIKKIRIQFILAWIILISISFFSNYNSGKKEQKRIAIQSARSFFNQILITRLWNSQHEGVYAAITEKTKSNPYLDTPMKDIKINDKLTLTKINPSYMTRQISEIALKQNGIQFHMTSLNPIRPENKPTEIEKKFLNKFETGIEEMSVFQKEGEENSFFYMAPLKTEKSCLQCHAKQGYKLGDIRGGISITLPFIMKIPIFTLLIGHLLIGILGIISIMFSTRKLNKAYETIKHQAIFDALTEVPNRRSFTESIIKEYKSSQRSLQPLSIIMCDVDNFKAYNDSYGHSGGDKCLKTIAQLIKSSLERPGDFVARYGGEEFVVLLPNTPTEGVIHVAERIRSNVEQATILHKKSLPKKIVTLSLGVATSEKATYSSYEELVKHADMGLYEAKEKGRNQVQFFKLIK